MAPQGPGLYFDGKTGKANAVTVTLDDASLAISTADGMSLTRWDYVATEELPATADRLRLSLADHQTTARLEIRDPAFADAVKQHLGIGTPQHQARLRRERRLVVLWSAAAVASVLTIALVGLPALASILTPLVPPSREQRIGAVVHAQEMKRYSVKGPLECGSAGERERAGEAAFRKLFSQVEKAADLPYPIRVHIIRSNIINAGAIPGGILHFNKGIIEFSRSPAELASVMGHELGHLAHRHGLRGYLHRVGLAYLVAVTLGDVFTGGGVILASYGVLDRRNTRAQERQADSYGVQVITRLGADTHAGADLWDRMAALQKKNPPRTLLSYTHPASAERAIAIRATPRVANPRPLLTPEEWQTLRQVCSGG
jgi:Zn-dependent protease with chaperone function